MIHCACLLEKTNDAIMLVRVRDNELWYLPGGTIEENETAEEALVREVDEELNVRIDTSSIEFDRIVVGPALGREGDVELKCYRAKWYGEVEANAEVSEVSFVGFEQVQKMAPAVKLLVKQIQNELAK